MSKRILSFLLVLAVFVISAPQVQAQVCSTPQWQPWMSHEQAQTLSRAKHQCSYLNGQVFGSEYGYGNYGYDFGRGHNHYRGCGHSGWGYYGGGRHITDVVVDRLLYGRNDDRPSENVLYDQCVLRNEDSCDLLLGRDKGKYDRAMKVRAESDRRRGQVEENPSHPEGYEREQGELQPREEVRQSEPAVPVVLQPKPAQVVVIENLSGVPAKVFAEDGRTIKLAPEQTLHNRPAPRRRGFVLTSAGWVQTEVEFDSASGHFLVMPRRPVKESP